MNIFEFASRNKLRFQTAQGYISAEELWDLPLSSKTGRANLDAVAISLHAKLQTPQISFVQKETATNQAEQVAFDIVKHVIDVRLTEAAAKADADSRKERKQQLLALLAEKQTEELRGKSSEEIQALIAAL